MKKWLIVILLLPTLVLLFFGKQNWDQKLEQNVVKAEKSLKTNMAVDKSSTLIGGKESKVQIRENSNLDPQDTQIRENNLEIQDIQIRTSSLNHLEAVVENEPNVEINVIDEPIHEEARIHDEKQNENDGGQISEGLQTMTIQYEKQSIGTIKDKYFLLFRELEKTQNSSLDRLYTEAYNEYEFYNGQNISFSRDEFLSKYEKMANELEVKADNAFYRTYEKMKKELAYNGFSEVEAEPFLRVYEVTKERRRSSLLSVIK